MQPRRLVQASCLLLFVAVALGRSLHGDVETASAEVMAAIPAAAQPALTKCLGKYGRRGCLWDATCNAQLKDCLVCQAAGSGQFTCLACQPGFFIDKAGTACTRCAAGFYCPGISHQEKCDEGATTPGTAPLGRWDPNQCSSCLPGYGNADCTPCAAGFFKPRVGTEPCSACPDGFVSNSVKGATECVNALAPVDPYVCPANSFIPKPAAGGVPSLKSCECIAGYGVKLTGNDNFLKSPFFNQNSQPSGTPARQPAIWPVGCEACSAKKASHPNNPTSTGSSACTACPANSTAGTADGKKETGSNTICICNDGFRTPGGAPNKPATCPEGLWCPTSFTAGCEPNPAPPRPGNGNGNGGHDDDDDDEESEWGHWGKHGKKHWSKRARYYDDDEDEHEHEKDGDEYSKDEKEHEKKDEEYEKYEKEYEREYQRKSRRHHKKHEEEDEKEYDDDKEKDEDKY